MRNRLFSGLSSARAATLASLLLCIAGCNSGGTSPSSSPTTPAGKPCATPASRDQLQIPVRVIRILHHPDDDSAGDQVAARNNLGCRLSDGQIASRVRSAPTYYLNKLNIDLQLEFSGSGTPKALSIYNQQVNLLQTSDYAHARLRMYTDFVFCELYKSTWISGSYSRYCINLFFTGHVCTKLTKRDEYSAIAFTYDAAVCWQSPGIPRAVHNTVYDANQTLTPFIAVNDIAAEDPLPVVEHELGHWFLRGVPPIYDADEHLPGSGYLMCAGESAGLDLYDLPNDPRGRICESESMYNQARHWNCRDDQGNDCIDWP